MANVQNEEKKFQSENNVEITGILEKIKVRQTKKDGSPLQTKKGIPMKTATIEVTVAEGEKHRIDMMAMKYYESNPKEDTRQWKAFETFETEYISREMTNDASSPHVGGTPHFVTVVGNIDANVFVNQAGETQENTRIQGRFMRREDNITPEDFGARFQVSGFVKANPVPEVVREEETGRYIVDFRLIDYQNKAIPLKLVAGQIDDEGETIDIGEWVEENIEMNQTMSFNGLLVNRYIVKEIPRENHGIGKKAVDTKRDVVRENVIEGGGIPTHFEEADEETDKQRVVFADQIQESVSNYDKFVADTEASSKNKGGAGTSTKSKKGFGAGASKKTTAKPVVDADSLPF